MSNVTRAAQPLACPPVRAGRQCPYGGDPRRGHRPALPSPLRPARLALWGLAERYRLEQSGSKQWHEHASYVRIEERELEARALNHLESGRKFWLFGASTCRREERQGGACLRQRRRQCVSPMPGEETDKSHRTDIGSSLPLASYLRIDERELEAGGRNERARRDGAAVPRGCSYAPACYGPVITSRVARARLCSPELRQLIPPHHSKQRPSSGRPAPLQLSCFRQATRPGRRSGGRIAEVREGGEAVARAVPA